MKGSVLMGGLLIAAGAMGVGLWYSMERAYYVEITDVEEVMAYGDAFPVQDYRGIDADTSPLKMRACFKVDWDYFPTDEYKDVATPLIAPKSFDCFDAKKVPEDAAAKNIMRDANHPLHTINVTPNNGDAPEAMLIDGQPIVAFSTDAKFYYACFQTGMSFGLLTETYEISDDAMPAKPLGEMACYDQEQIAQDVASGEALSLVGQRNIIDGIDRIIAVYPDGRAFAWHQKAQ